MPMIFGMTSAGIMVPVRVDANGKLSVVELPAVSLAADQNVQARLHAWDGAAWRKSNFPLAYVGAISQNLSNTDLAAGTNTLTGTTVPAGEVWIITNWAIYYTGTVTSVELIPTATIGGNLVELSYYNPVVSNHRYTDKGWISLAAGDKTTAYILSATLHDDAFYNYSGHKFQIAQ